MYYLYTSYKNETASTEACLLIKIHGIIGKQFHL